MSDIPQQQPMTPETAFELLQFWFLDAQALAELKTKEILNRKRLAAYYFPHPVKGTNRIQIDPQHDLKFTLSYNVTVDEAALDNVTAKQIKDLKLPWDDLFVYKPTLAGKVYNELTAEQKKFVDQLLDSKEASPKLEIVPRANVEGQQAHIAAAEAAKDNGIKVVLDAESAEPGDYYFDGETWWQLNDAVEWDEVPADDEALIQSLTELHTIATPAKPKRGRKKKDA